MKTLSIRHAQGAYPVLIGSRLENRLASWLARRQMRRLVLISHPELLEQYGRGLSESLVGLGFDPVVLSVPSGEESKTLEEAGRLYDELGRHLIERQTPVLALGGGVIGDLAGFVAATFMRGLPLVHLPTTLLAQVDSSLGGKTALNIGSFKNQMGVFYPPQAVFSDLEALKTLPAREIENGLAEMIKCSVIRSPRLFLLMERYMDRLREGDERVIEEAIFMTAAVKAWFVSRDEREIGLRQVLNLGHTVGHAVEAVTNFQVSHGQAVAIGLVAAAKAANRLKLFPDRELGRLLGLVALAGLPLAMPGIDLAEVMEAMKHDKKISRGRLRFVLPVHIGRVVIRELEPEFVAEVLAEL
ncbi:MAG: 3-dehydroquinate synthase [Dehalococcoidia bacterium]|nr:3-dehydroquinate synthase [Dehalococcoidia bacterium]